MQVDVYNGRKTVVVVVLVAAWFSKIDICY